MFWNFKKKNGNFRKFSDFFLHDEKIFFIQIFFCYLDYVSRVPENYTERSRVTSGRDRDRVWGGFSWLFMIFAIFECFGSSVGLGSWRKKVSDPIFSKSCQVWVNWSPRWLYRITSGFQHHQDTCLVSRKKLWEVWKAPRGCSILQVRFFVTHFVEFRYPPTWS